MTLELNQPTTVLLVTRGGMGDAPPELQQKLAITYFRLLAENDMLPGAICFYAEGVKLVCAGSPVLDSLKVLVEKGVHLIACSTCLDFYEL